MLPAVNKAFTKEDETNEPAVVPPRAPLPTGTPNYVTFRGLTKLKTELKELDEERARIDAQVPAADRSFALSRITARKSALEDRLSTAMLVDASKQPRDEVRFGASVRVRGASRAQRTYKIVGVDEAEPGAGLVAFVSPVARALIGCAIGDIVSLHTPRGEEELEIVGIEYDDNGAR
jgi:transcription elongation factor GreB